MADWTGTIDFNESKTRALEAFIREPDTRHGDVFDQGTFGQDDAIRVDWVIKHDLFEGVVIHFSLMSGDGNTFLGGDGAALLTAQDVFNTYRIPYQGRRYAITVRQV